MIPRILSSERIMKTIAKNKMLALLDSLIKKYQVFAPVQKDDLVVDFNAIQSGDEVYLEYNNSNEPVKKMFFPQSETLFTYTKGSPAEAPDLKPMQPRVIFGVRPCDTKSLSLMDAVFDDPDFKDPYYLEKRKNTTIFTLACNDPRNNCFCSSLGYGPYFKKDTDVFMVDLGEKYLLEPISTAGGKIIKNLPGLEDAQKNELSRLKELESEANGKVTKKVDLKNLPGKLSEIFDHPIWDEIHEKCIGCGVCTYFCPTCHCFDMVDEVKDDKGRRVRVWDSCMYPAFTQEASGHNPRETGKERMRQRLMHKFKYFVDNYDEIACVGCGRCINSCPVGSDLVEVIGKINNLK